MDVILKQDVDKLGLRGEVVHVARGYARNFLFPRGLAEVATPALVRELEKREAQRARHEAKSVDEGRALAKRIEALELRFDVNAGRGGTLFGSVTATNVADRLWEQEKIRVDRRKIEMETIKRVGRHTVRIELFTDVTADLHLAVAPEGEELPTEDELAAAAEHEADAARDSTGAGTVVAPPELAAPDAAPDVEWPAPADEAGTGFAAAATVAAEDASADPYADELSDDIR